MKAVWVAGGLLAGVVCAAPADDVLNDSAYEIPVALLQAADQQQFESQQILDGQWVSNCYQFEPGLFQVRTFKFVLNQLATITTISYPDQYCQQIPAGASTVSATWDLGDKLTTEEGLEAFALDVLLRVGKTQELTTVNQIIHVRQDSFFLGINKNRDQYPERLDWEIEYTRI